MSFRKLSEIVELADRKNKEFWEPVIEEDMKERNVSFAESFETMRQMLHAWKLEIRHPTTGEQMSFVAPPPDDMKAYLGE